MRRGGLLGRNCFVTFALIIILMAVSCCSVQVFACRYNYTLKNYPLDTFAWLDQNGSAQFFFDVAERSNSYYAVGSVFVKKTVFDNRLNITRTEFVGLALIARLDGSLHKLWVEALGNSSGNYKAFSIIAPGSTRDIYITGTTTASLFGETDFFLAVMDSGGRLIKFECIGSPQNERVLLDTKYYNGNIYLIGESNDTGNGLYGVMIIRVNGETQELEGAYVIKSEHPPAPIYAAPEAILYHGELLVPGAIVFNGSKYGFIAIVNLSGMRLEKYIILAPPSGNVSSIAVYPVDNYLYTAIDVHIPTTASGYRSEIMVLKIPLNTSYTIESYNAVSLELENNSDIAAIHYDPYTNKLYLMGDGRFTSTLDPMIIVLDGNLRLEALYYQKTVIKMGWEGSGGEETVFTNNILRCRVLNGRIMLTGVAVRAGVALGGGGGASSSSTSGGDIYIPSSCSSIYIFNPQSWSKLEYVESNTQAVDNLAGTFNITLVEAEGVGCSPCKVDCKNYTLGFSFKTIYSNYKIILRVTQPYKYSGVIKLICNSELHSKHFGSGRAIIVSTDSIANDTITSNGAVIGYILAVKRLVTVFSNASITRYYINGRNITIVFSNPALISIAAAEGAVYSIYKNGALVCKGLACSSLRDSDGVITLEPTTITIVSSKTIRGVNAGGVAGGSCYMGGREGMVVEKLLPLAPVLLAAVIALSIKLSRRVVVV